ncbi:hypothetical protein HPC49_24560 [Pyxidicoccus fallax]|uniref:Uncharacterized protein n=1 Tax=Pyxidicoccus fallax TaxID=394095 RepID=A0A848LJJ1_9BACT|nr:hypothetical protein [Pyxidicoccus fallax]NMO17858.1 hypothetical protein [Pyxidicoccus fallax]NPC81390.1 hypothetical protein [Pyxidicoccus fallax]
MAPFLGPTRAEVLATLHGPGAEKRLPLTVGRNTPAAIISVRDRRWMLRLLVLDEADVERRYQESLARGDGWMPEMQWGSLKEGAPLLEADSRWAHGP